MRELISMVCVTNRPHFAEAVRASYEGQRWPNKELVVIDSSEDGTILKDYADVHVRAEPGTWVGPLRNIALRATTGDYLMWFDDDDWRHPDLTRVLMGRMEAEGTEMAGLNCYFWIDIDGRMSRRYPCHNWPVFAASIYRNLPEMPPFRQKPLHKTDTYWLLRYLEKIEDSKALVNRPEMFGYVHHTSNVHNEEEPKGKATNEHDARFLPGSPLGLSAHMERLRVTV